MINTVKEFFKFFETVLNQLAIEITNLRRTEMQPELKLIMHWLLIAYWHLIASFIRGCAFIVNSIIFIYEMLFVGLPLYIQKEYIRIKLLHRMHNPPKIDKEQLEIDKQRWEEWEASEEGKEYLKQLEQNRKQTEEVSK